MYNNLLQSLIFCINTQEWHVRVFSRIRAFQHFECFTQKIKKSCVCVHLFMITDIGIPAMRTLSIWWNWQNAKKKRHTGYNSHMYRNTCAILLYLCAVITNIRNNLYVRMMFEKNLYVNASFKKCRAKHAFLNLHVWSGRLRTDVYVRLILRWVENHCGFKYFLRWYLWLS
jgi:hypothetical protein